MSAARIEYKCRRCGKITASLEGGYDLVRTQLIMMTIDDSKQIGGGFHARLLDVHHCEDGGMGISDCIGMRKEE